MICNVLLFLLIPAVLSFEGVTKEQAASYYKLSQVQNLTMLDVFKFYGYRGERYEVVTKDGFILSLYRLPANCPREYIKQIPVLLLHGFTSSSFDFVVGGPKQSLGFFLSDSCYDVWMGNNRGNFLSQGNLYYTPDQTRYWDYSFHEMGVYDVPAFISFIQKKTKKQMIHYIGHSDGALEFFVYCSIFPEICSKNIYRMQALAPPVYLKNVKGPFKSLLQMNPGFEFFPSYGEFAMKLRNLNRNNNLTGISDLLTNLAGPDGGQILSPLLKVVAQIFPAGASTGQAKHILQQVNTGEFRRFDFGKKNNLKVYGTAYSPEYPIQDIQVPVHLHYGLNDYLAPPSRVLRLAGVLPNNQLHQVPYEQWSHFDFIFGKDAIEYLYKHVLEIMNQDCGATVVPPRTAPPSASRPIYYV